MKICNAQLCNFGIGVFFGWVPSFMLSTNGEKTSLQGEKFMFFVYQRIASNTKVYLEMDRGLHAYWFKTVQVQGTVNQWSLLMSLLCYAISLLLGNWKVVKIKLSVKARGVGMSSEPSDYLYLNLVYYDQITVIFGSNPSLCSVIWKEWSEIGWFYLITHARLWWGDEILLGLGAGQKSGTTVLNL